MIGSDSHALTWITQPKGSFEAMSRCNLKWCSQHLFFVVEVTLVNEKYHRLLLPLVTSSSSTYSIYFSYLFTLSIPIHPPKDLQLILIQCWREMVYKYRTTLDRHCLMALVHRLLNLHLQERLCFILKSIVVQKFIYIQLHFFLQHMNSCSFSVKEVSIRVWREIH